MAFSLAGTTITQTGTDADLSGLGAISGVTTSTVGTGSNIYTVYNVGNRKLTVQGTLTADPRKEQLLFGTSSPANSVDIVNGGVFNVGVDITNGSHTYQSQGIAIIVPSASLPACCSDAAMTVRSGGTFNWRGAEIRVASAIHWIAGSNINITNGRLRNTRGSLVRIRSFSSALNIDGFEVDNGDSIDFFQVPVSFSGLSPQDGDRAIEYISGDAGGTNDLYLNEGYNSNAMNYDFSVWDGADVKILNAFKTVDNVAGPTNVLDSLLRQFGSTRITVKNQAGTELQDVKGHFQDFDNGNRSNIQPRSGVDYSLDQTKTYTDTSGVDGFLDLEVMTRASYPSTTIRNESGYNYMEAIDDWRTENSDNSILVQMISYNHQHASVSVDMASGSRNDFDWILLGDNLITEVTKSTVDAYLTIDSPQQLYDRAKAYLVDTYAGETVTIVSRTGDTVDLGSHNLDLVPTGSAFIFDGTTITVNSNLFEGNITTTGVITDIGNVVNGNLFDSNRDSSLSEINGLSFTIYASEADRDNRANAVANDVTNYPFLFASPPASTVYLWVNSGATELPTQVTLVQGVNTFDLGTAGVLNSLSNTIQYIPSSIYIDETLAISGTGTLKNPVNTIAAAKIISEGIGSRSLVSINSLTLNEPVTGYDVIGGAGRNPVNLNGQDVNTTKFKQLSLTGTAVSNAGWEATDVSLDNVNGLNGTYKDSFVTGVLTPKDGGVVHMVNISSGVPGLSSPTLDLTGLSGVKLDLRGYKGGLNIVGSTSATNEMTISGEECKYVVDSSCTAGVLSLRGIGQLTDNSGGIIVDTDSLVQPDQSSPTVEEVATAVWEDAVDYVGAQKGKVLVDAKNKANLAVSLSA